MRFTVMSLCDALLMESEQNQKCEYSKSSSVTSALRYAFIKTFPCLELIRRFMLCASCIVDQRACMQGSIHLSFLPSVLQPRSDGCWFKRGAVRFSRIITLPFTFALLLLIISIISSSRAVLQHQGCSHRVTLGPFSSYTDVLLD